MSEKVKVYVKRLVPEAKMPERAHYNDAGADVFAVRCEADDIYKNFNAKTRNLEKFRMKYGTGLAFAVDDNHWLDLRPRSSVYKTGMIMCNPPGTVDAGYRGEVMMNFYCIGNCEPYMVGDKIGQIVVMPDVSPLDVEFVEVDELPSSERGEGGFGSTGK